MSYSTEMEHKSISEIIVTSESLLYFVCIFNLKPNEPWKQQIDNGLLVKPIPLKRQEQAVCKTGTPK